MEDAGIGPGCVLFPGVVVYHHCELGSGVIVNANTVIGADGFGYRPAPDGSGLVKIPQIGTVKIGNDVEIGAGACIDRGKFSATVIGDGTKIDNLCHIAHNCRIGKGCVLAAQVGLSGSVVVGDGVAIGGQVGVADHFTVGDGAQLAAQAGVISDVPAGATWFGTPAHDLRATLREAVALRRLPDLIKTLKKTSTQDG
jgi:UDP-3-O-[3-hydroxymyristoyl] glucosamine N-acyltransferase